MSQGDSSHRFSSFPSSNRHIQIAIASEKKFYEEMTKMIFHNTSPGYTISSGEFKDRDG